MAANPDFIYTPPMSPYLDIIYQDSDIVIINKTSGILSVPGRLPEHQDCLQNRVQRVLPTATIVHRLDMATSGLMLLALNKPAHVAISRQFEKRQTQKSYIARVYGQVAQDQGSVDLPLICDWPNRPKQMVDHDYGKAALTHYKVLSRDTSNERNSTLVELSPVTGRSHQLRVHMLALGHPILGDRLYANPQALALSPRLQLHALSLSFTHPSTQAQVSFNAPCPFN
ncbi:bifunctional tRNA pseudouridine(32) synthase/23S rRNA pseudouridine(746) synthase RluA [Colwellia sp. D2M02]|uniref:bifunctional tRNA pseudouridine(32) synthase/23S rRNA pseudouridine(746) synthase RluA n=1 Tax=Colwellia sp. D2M02 TaxID=2841562 RepID=UPI001C09835F|nr:bifunctional tRNA pseudouridine(32) synthase/23S rRNA pseudouridine(746) synthase RluA [Colwellia sp. D2M02]MBU2894162.1 bifunctional tRNA pseudouridine(32) synthase/23S rRNA pseudouridine(746) synthase RluA [Colwellia sp. D2M02]